MEAVIARRADAQRQVELGVGPQPQYHNLENPKTVVISGGCFQNRLLYSLLTHALEKQNVNLSYLSKNSLKLQ